MKKIRIILFVIMCFLLGACQPQAAPVAPTQTATTAPTPTVTPTPQPRQLSINELLQDCEQLSAEKRTVILDGAVYLPDDTITGYEIDGVRWLGLDLIKTDQVKVLIRVGNENGTMDDLPAQFNEKDLIIRASDGRLILDRNRIQVTGKAAYRKDKPEQQCEVFADAIEAKEDPEILVPLDLTVGELLNNDRINDCPDVEKANQLVRMHGWIMVNDDDTVCAYGKCRTPFSDGSGKMMLQLASGGGPNSIGGMDVPYQLANVRLIDQNGGEADPADVVLIGQISGITEYCQLTVFSILPAGSN